MPDVFIVIDVQPVFDGVIPRFDRLMRRLVLVTKALKELGFYVVGTEQYPEKFGETPQELRSLYDEVVSKMTFDAFAEPKFKSLLDNMKPSRVFISGIETHICVLQTVASSVKLYKTYLLRDLTSSYAELEEEVALREMERIGAIITSSESVIYREIGDSRREIFKKVLPLIKEMRKL